MDRFKEINEVIDQFESNQMTLSEFRYLIGNEVNKLYSQAYEKGFKASQRKIEEERKYAVLLEYPGSKLKSRVVKLASVPSKGVVVELPASYAYMHKELVENNLEFYVKESKRIIDPELDYEFIVQLKLLK